MTHDKNVAALLGVHPWPWSKREWSIRDCQVFVDLFDADGKLVLTDSRLLADALFELVGSAAAAMPQTERGYPAPESVVESVDPLDSMRVLNERMAAAALAQIDREPVDLNAGPMPAVRFDGGGECVSRNSKQGRAADCTDGTDGLLRSASSAFIRGSTPGVSRNSREAEAYAAARENAPRWLKVTARALGIGLYWLYRCTVWARKVRAAQWMS